MKAITVLFLCVVSGCLAGRVQWAFPRPQYDRRIVGGVETEIEDLPHQLSLVSNQFHMCGASIISEEWAVTAAHCVRGSSPEKISLRSGSSKINGLENGTIHPASMIIVHEKYDPLTVDYDIAVIKVSKQFVFGRKVKAIPLQPFGQTVPSGTEAIVSGWGTTSSGGNISFKLRKVTVQIIDHKECNNAYELYSGITDRMICAGIPGGGKDSCQGDSGGPLITKEGRTLVGIVSWGLDCAAPKYPGVYTDVSTLRDWIKEKTDV